MIGSQLTDWMLNCMQYCPFWEADSSLGNQQTLHILSNPKVHHVCTSLQQVPVQNQIRAIHVCQPVSSRTNLMLSTLLCLGLPNGHSICVSGAVHNWCCLAVMHFSTWLYPLWEPFSLLDFIASELCFIWLCNRMSVKWSVLWSKVLLHFNTSDCGLVTVGWDYSKICLFCTVGIEGVLCDCYLSAGVMLLWWVENIWRVLLWSGSLEHCMF
jgi:hypothetical protein